MCQPASISSSAASYVSCGSVRNAARSSGSSNRFVSTTVYLTNVFFLPPDLSAFLALPHETFDTAEELARAGWRVD